MQSWQKRMDLSRNKADVIIAKNRHGKPETVHLSFNGDVSLFDNLHQYQQVPEQDFAPQYPQTNDSSVQEVVDINDLPDDII